MFRDQMLLLELKLSRYLPQFIVSLSPFRFIFLSIISLSYKVAKERREGWSGERYIET